MEQTLTLIKPRAVAQNHTAPILHEIYKAGFRIKAVKTIQLNKSQAEKFYSVHNEKPFFASLIDFMTSGPIMAIVLEKEDAVENLRQLMGNTDPVKALNGTIRQKFGLDKQQNSIHGSDSKENALKEIQFFFSEHEL
ncbi:MAG: nucleoside-diphosphate kinase [Bacteroidota bacterium]